MITTESLIHQKLMPGLNKIKWLLYDRVIQHSQIPVNKSDMKWNWSFNETCKSLKGILVLFEEEKPFARDMSKFYNPKIQKVTITIEGKPDQLYFQGMRSFDQYDEGCKYLAEGRLANETQAQLQLYDVSVGEYLVKSMPYGSISEQ